MAYYRLRPPKNQQDSIWTCWAAAIDSFSRVTPVVPSLKEKDLVASFGSPPYGALTPSKFSALQTKLAIWDVRCDLIHPHDFTDTVVEERLRESHIVLLRSLGSSDLWHAWVIYGIDNWLIYMDVEDGEYHKALWFTVSSAKGYYLLWRPK